MSLAIPTKEPQSIRAGNTVKFNKTFSDYPVADGWTCAYKIVGNAAAPISATVTPVGTDEYDVVFAASLTDDLPAGGYMLIGTMTKAGERYTVYEGTLEVEADVAAASAATDTRSHAAKTLAAIDAAIESYAVTPVEEIQIAGRLVRRPSLETLYKFKSTYEGIVRREEDKERIARGEKSRKLVVSFPPVS
jgi:hypothetical protein